MPTRRREDIGERARLDDDPLWYKDAVVYELHVRAFQDSDGDGVGDFRGLTSRLDYLQQLGATALWLLPFYPSPLRDDGYDIADYQDVHPSCGTLADFRTFLREAHRRGIRVITELVINHTSDRHPWFQRARRAPPGSSHRDFYVWSDRPDRYPEARVIFQDFEASNWTWDPVAGAYYWHRFYAHQPDLNFDNPAVHRAILQAMRFWLDLGVDGLRLDAVPYLYEREGTSCENLPQTHQALKALRRRVDERHHNRMLLAEANQWPEDAVSYFGQGDECHMAFHFPLMPRMFMALRMEDRFPIVDILSQTPPIPETCQWALFLRNHDELTLEMVTDEERDYMVRVYAHDPQARLNLGIRRRLLPLLGRGWRKYELMNALLLSLPGTPVIYYGDEIGMGDNIYLGDRNGVRTPMQWNADRNAGFSQAPAQKLFLPVIVDPEYHYEAVNVETQLHNPSSPLWFTRRLLALRRRHRAFGRGTLEFCHPSNHRVLAFVRRYQDERILVVANLSRFSQFVELDLSAFAGLVPVELFGRTEFPPIRGKPYPLTLGPHSFFWFELTQRRPEADEPAGAAQVCAELPVLVADGPWDRLLRRESLPTLERLLPDFLAAQEWFGGRSRPIQTTTVVETILFADLDPPAYLLAVRVEYAAGDPETYALPLGFAAGRTAERIARESPRAVLARVRADLAGILFDALTVPRLGQPILEAIAHRRRVRAGKGELLARPIGPFREAAGDHAGLVEPCPLRGHPRNTLLVYSDRLVLKVFRRVEEGVNPELELGTFLTEKARFPYVAPVLGALEYHRAKREPATLAVLHGFVPNQGDAWTLARHNLGQYYERVAARPAGADPADCRLASPLELAGAEPPASARDLVGTDLAVAELLGRRTAELHGALAGDASDPAFAPQPFSTLYQRSLYESMRQTAARALELLGARREALPAEARERAERLLALRARLDERFRALLGRKLGGARIRIHGSLRLDQALYTGRDFVFVGLEGDPGVPVSVRRLKRSPLRDVVGLLRSFDYAAFAPLVGEPGSALLHAQAAALDPWARCWSIWTGATFLRSYLEAASRFSYLPAGRDDLALLLDTLLLDKTLRELSAELNERPAWVGVPLRAALRALGEDH
ncbi:MAG: maltose alpha-D-glucosyltransferase [Deltaproteobacteria bacterium]|nr:maltose alpha-D-glucosyltransferase [Deltaproteobacteria bacterium]